MLAHPACSPRSPALQPWQVVLFEREGQRGKTASTTASVSGHGGEVATSNPDLLTRTRSPRARTARPPRVYCICFPLEPYPSPRHSPARRTTCIISFYIMAGHFCSDFTATFDTLLDTVHRGAPPPGYTARWHRLTTPATREEQGTSLYLRSILTPRGECQRGHFRRLCRVGMAGFRVPCGSQLGGQPS